MKGITDHELIAGALSGNEASFAALVKRHQSAIATTAMAMLGNQHEAEEVGQLTFIRFYRSMAGFKGRSSLQTYLIRICINLCLDRLKQRKRQRDREFPLDAVADTGHRPRAEDELEARQFVETALNKLDKKHRAIVVLRMIHGYSTKETAELLGLPQGTVLSRLKRGMDSIRNQWSDEYTGS